MGSTSRIVIVSEDAISGRMAGPAIRCWEWAAALADTASVTLAAPSFTDVRPAGFTLERYRGPGDLKSLTQSADATIISGYTLRRCPFLQSLSCPLVVDLSHSFVLESLQTLARYSLERQWALFAERWRVLNELLLAGDFFVCNTERQRDYWLGMLSALGRINPATYTDDPTLRQLIDVVPFGLPAHPPQKTGPVLKGVYKSIEPTDKVILWGGGIYDWLDPLTLIEAVGQMARLRNDVKVFFAGIRHPNPHVTPMEMVGKALALSDSKDLTDRFVFFNDWVHYQARADYLLESDIGISLHLQHLEARYAFRTRSLDYIWAALPIVCTEGDTLADLVRREDLGRVVPVQDAEALVAAILDLVDQPDLRANLAPRFAGVAARHTWDITVRPLARFCQSPRTAPDRERLEWLGKKAQVGSTAGLSLWQERLSKGGETLRRDGPGALWHEITSLFRWRRGR